MTPSTVATWALNGTKVEFDVPFDYLSRTFVQVTLIGTTNRELSIGNDFQFITPTRIQLFQAYGPPDFNLIEIRRNTSTTERLVEFHDASILTASDMNTADLQVLHVAEEARNAATESIGVNNDGHLDARGRRIINLANAVGPQDAVPFKQYKDDAQGAYQSRLAAKASEDAAKASQTAAKSSQDAAKVSQTASKTSEDAAKASQTASKVSQDAAAASASAAKASQDAAKASQDAAKGSEQSVATNAGIASSSAAAAKASETNAKSSQTAASQSQTAAKASEESAKASSQAAEVSKGSAQASQTAAAGSATAAAGSASGASSSAAAAKTSEGLSKSWAVKMDGPVEAGEYSSKYWAQSAANSVIPVGSISWDKLDADVRDNRFLKLSGGPLTGPLGVAGNVTLGRVGTTNSRLVLDDGSPSSSFIRGQDGGTEVFTSGSTVNYAARLTAAGNLHVRGGIYESDNQRVATLAEIKTSAGLLLENGEAPKSVTGISALNNMSQWVSGIVRVSGFTPVDYGHVLRVGGGQNGMNGGWFFDLAMSTKGKMFTRFNTNSGSWSGWTQIATMSDIPSIPGPPSYTRRKSGYSNLSTYTNSSRYPMFVTARSGTSQSIAKVAITVAGTEQASGHYGFGSFIGPVTINATVGPGETWQVSGSTAIETLIAN